MKELREQGSTPTLKHTSEELTLSSVEFQCQLLACPGLLCQPLLQFLLLLEQLIYLLVVVEGLPHQLGLGQTGMFEL